MGYMGQPGDGASDILQAESPTRSEVVHVLLRDVFASIVSNYNDWI